MPSADASSVTTQVDGRTLALTNLDKPLFDTGFSKAEVIDYLLRVAPVALPHLEGRCLTRKRFPDGASADGFYEKNLPPGTPEWVARQQVLASGTTISYPLVTGTASLAWLGNLAALEFHTPQWRVGGLTRPADHELAIDLDAEPLVLSDRLVVDLDPGEGMTMVDSSRAAMVVATELADQGLIPFVKTSGSKGLQVFAPIHPAPWQQVVAAARGLAQTLARRHPQVFVAVMAKQQRTDRIFVDYLQNQAARNTIAAYSLRAKDFESVSTPLDWEEVAAVDAPGALAFTAGQVLERIERGGDPWAEMLQPGTAGALPRWKLDD
ncbi:non-homologous end-joining DNA ligase [Luteococcus peritonei]|uniref:Non-homologous end-joining DNA ligase n=1 Tax=Luteococcus peritonei TaxID=88874 RepID=A0ABW4RSY1_9ACTN